MNLSAYSKIVDLGSILNDIDVDIVRLRGLELMEFNKRISEEEIKEEIEAAKKSAAERWLNQHCWTGFSTWKNHYRPKALIYNSEDEVVGYDFKKIHGKDRKILKFKFKQLEKAIHSQYNLFNDYCGKKVLYVHARQGGCNRNYCGMNEISKHPLYLEDVDDSFDNTYCDIYFDISNIDIDNYINNDINE